MDELFRELTAQFAIILTSMPKVALDRAKILKSQLYDQTGAGSGFLVCRVQAPDEYVCYASGTGCFRKPVCVDLEDTLFQNAIHSKRTLRTDFPTSAYIETIKKFLRLEQPKYALVVTDDEASDSDPDIKSVIVVPFVSTHTMDVVAIACLVKFSRAFAKTDEIIASECCRFLSPIVLYSLAHHTERTTKIQNEELLKVARNIFSHMMELPTLLFEITQEALNLTSAERCSVYLVDEDHEMLVAKILDNVPTSLEDKLYTTSDGTLLSMPKQISLPIDEGVVGYVATTGEALNIKDATTHPLCYGRADQHETRNILCFPIKNEEDGVIGVAELCDKNNYPYFTSNDETIAKAFASLLYKKVQTAQNRVRLANEMMTYHMMVSKDQLDWLNKCAIPSLESLITHPDSFESIPRALESDDASTLAVLAMFERTKLIEQYSLHRNTLSHFILMARKGYRPQPFHNWIHAVAVTHFIYLCERNFNLQEAYMSRLEFFAMLVSAVCHDLDHRGTTNAFQVSSSSLLASLYSSEGSVMERHHLSQTLCILNTEGCNIFESLSSEDYTRMLDLISHNIIATDLSQHFAISIKQKEMAEKGYRWANKEHRKLLLSLLMTAADLSDQTKRWPNVVNVAKLIYEEFFQQGDMEKALGQAPAVSMDRERACVPKLQIDFLDLIIIPLFETFVQLFPTSTYIVRQIRGNRIRWMNILHKVDADILDGSGLKLFEYDLIFE